MTTGKRPDGEIFASGATEGEVLEFPSVPRGWGVTVDGKDETGEKVTDPTNGIPPMEWFNALQQRTDNSLLWLLQNALPGWATGTWPAGSVIVNDDVVYRALKETATEPTSDTGDWLALFPVADLDKRYLHVDKNLADLNDAGASRDNLGLGDLATKDNLTAADVGAYPLTGGNLHEDAHINLISGDQSPSNGDSIYSPWLRCCLKGRGGNQDFSDGGSCLMRVVEKVGEIAYIQLLWDGFGSTHAFEFDQNGKFHAPSDVHAGDAFMATDGNVYGSCWGGYLNNWIVAKFITAVRLGASSEYQERGDNERLAGGVMTSFKDAGSSNYWIRLRPLQYMINGAWITAAYE